jgi:AcrR family transcriptional regulator
MPTPAQRPDRRVNRTRRLLREALTALILEKGYDAVTIEDITRRADLGRTTFYLHYRDKEHLFLESIEQSADELAQRISQIPAEMLFNENGEGAGLPITLVFEHAAQNADLYRAMLRSEGSIKATSRLRELTAQYALEFTRLWWQQRGLTGQPHIPLEVIAQFFAASLLGTLVWWLEAGMPYPPRQMAAFFRRLVLDGLRNVQSGEN